MSAFTAGGRVTWFSDMDCWGTVIAIDGAGASAVIAVQWDGGSVSYYNDRTSAKIRPRLQVDKSQRLP